MYIISLSSNGQIYDNRLPVLHAYIKSSTHISSVRRFWFRKVKTPYFK